MARSGPFSCSNNILLLVRTEIVHAILYRYILYFSFMPRIKVDNFLERAMTVLKLPKLAPRCSFSTLEEAVFFAVGVACLRVGAR